MLNFN